MGWRALLDLLFPPQCAGCNALGSGLCDACASACERIRVRFPLLRVTAFGAYEGNLRAAVLALKDGRRDVAEALGPHRRAARRARLAARAGSDDAAAAARSRLRRRCGSSRATPLTISGARVALALEQRAGDAQRGRSRAQRLAAQRDASPAIRRRLPPVA